MKYKSELMHKHSTNFNWTWSPSFTCILTIKSHVYDSNQKGIGRYLSIVSEWTNMYPQYTPIGW